MPTYEYFCYNCKNITEILDLKNKYRDSKSIICPHCKKIARRKVSLTNFRLNGDGWYKKPPTEGK